MLSLNQKSLLFCAAVALAVTTATAELTNSEKDDIGFTLLKTQLGENMPTGSGISVSQVEAPDSVNYRPNSLTFSGHSFEFPSGGATGISSHATTVGTYLYGSNSLSPNLGSTSSGDKISSYEVNDWLMNTGLKYNYTNVLPATESNDIQNHSWIGNTTSASTSENILKRSDYAIRRDDYVAVFGLNNGLGTVPWLMASSYNGISVGLSNGNHSYGTTTVDGSGRSKPDIVVPTSLTSDATPTVSGAAALLLETARKDSNLTHGDRHEVVKALILNGATKEESEFSAKPWSNTSTAPLDPIYGTGELNILNSYNNLTAGKFNASTSISVNPNGWDLGSTSIGSMKTYFFDLPEGHQGTLSATLAWDRIITATDTATGSTVNYSLTSSLANLNLLLYQANGFALGSEVNQSASSTDNVEHLYLKNLTPGRYALAVSSDTANIDYGLAWQSTLSATTIPEPSSITFCVSAASLVLLRRKRS